MRNYAQFYAICKAFGLNKEDVVLDFTTGKTSSLSALDDGQWKELMIRLRKLQPVTKVYTVKPGDRQRKKLIAIAAKMHWGNTTVEIIGKLNSFLQKQYKKDLNELDVAELNKLVWVFENKVYKDFLKKL